MAMMVVWVTVEMVTVVIKGTGDDDGGDDDGGDGGGGDGESGDGDGGDGDGGGGADIARPSARATDTTASFDGSGVDAKTTERVISDYFCEGGKRWGGVSFRGEGGGGVGGVAPPSDQGGLRERWCWWCG